MRSFCTPVLLALGLCAGAARPASAQTYTLTAALTGGGEATTTANGVNTGAFGDATVVVDMAARTITYTVRVFNLPSGVTASRIHIGSPLTTGPVIVNFAPPVPASNDFGFSGVIRDTEIVLRAEQGVRTSDDALQAILAGNSYVNVHSAANPAGEVRGQLTIKP